MKITDYRFREVNKGNLKATVAITLDDAFVVTGLKICSGRNGDFVTMPSEKWSDGKYHDICYPITKKGRESISSAILKKYEEQKAGDNNDIPFE